MTTWLEAIRQREAAATKGPWRMYRCEFADRDREFGQACEVRFGPPGDEGRIFSDCARDECHHMVARVDANFIAYVREDIKPLLAVAMAAAELQWAVMDPKYSHFTGETKEMVMGELFDALAPLLQSVDAERPEGK